MSHSSTSILTGTAMIILSLSLHALEISLPPQPSKSEITAAQELEHYLPLTTTELTVAGKPAHIWLGDTETARAAGIDISALAEEEWTIRTASPDAVILCGGGQRGTLYACYHFLEDIIGIRWWNPFDDYLPEKRAVDLSGLALAGKPAFLIRDIYRNFEYPDDKGRWAARNRINIDGESRISLEYGSDLHYGLPYHTHSISRADGYLPPQEFFQEHPEYYSLVDGKRNGEMFKGQICFSHPDLPGIFIEKLKAFIAQDEKTAAEKGEQPPRVYDISINDNQAWCQCPLCTEALKTSRRSDLLLAFINRIAAFLADYRPGYFLQTAAYFTTLEPPLHERAADNVMVRACYTHGPRHLPIDSQENDAFRTVLRNWRGCAKHLSIWEYGITFDDSAGLPFSNEFVIADNKRFYRECGVNNILIEHEYPDVADMWDMKIFMEAKLMENPSLDGYELMTDFIGKYYGPAAPAILDYRKQLRQAVFNGQTCVSYFSPGRTAFSFLTWDAVCQMRKTLQHALLHVQDRPQIAERVQRAAFGLDLALGYSLRTELEKQARADAVSQEDFTRLADQALARAKATWQRETKRFIGVGTAPDFYQVQMNLKQLFEKN